MNLNPVGLYSKTVSKANQTKNKYKIKPKARNLGFSIKSLISTYCQLLFRLSCPQCQPEGPLCDFFKKPRLMSSVPTVSFRPPLHSFIP